MKKPHYGWVICITCTLLLLTTMGLISNVFAVYRPHIIAYNNFTNTQCAMITTIRCFLSLLSLFFINKFYKALNIRLGATIAVGLCALSYFIYSIADNIYGYYCAAAVSGLGYGLGTMVPISLIINRWFVRKRGLAISICSMGSGFASIIFPPIVTALINNTSLKTAFLLESIFMLVVGALVFILLNNTPEEKGLKPYGESADSTEYSKVLKPSSQPLTPKEWVWVCICVILYSAVSATGNSNMTLLFTNEGYDPMTVSFALSIFGLILSASKFMYGILTDKYGSYFANYFFGGFVLIGKILCCFSFTLNTPLLFICVIILAIGLPTSTVGYSMWAADFSDSRTYSKAIQRIQMFHCIGALTFESLPGILADITGSYIPAYALFAVFTILSIGGIQLLYIRRRKSAAQT